MFRTLLSIAALTMLLGSQNGSALAQGPGPARSGAKPPLASALNINTASASDLETLPGIGARTAARIVEYRQKNGPFKKVEDLMNIRGVGEKNFLKLRSQITVLPAKAERTTAQQ